MFCMGALRVINFIRDPSLRTTTVFVPTTETTPQTKASANYVRTSQTWAASDVDEKKEEESNPVGPYGFPLYNDKYM